VILGALALIALAAAWLLLFHDNGCPGFAREPAEPRGDVETVWFPAVDGTRLEGWLLRPETWPAPLVVMAPGLTGTKDAHLEPFARAFQRAGIAVLLLDFRTFGGSDGEPRHWVDPVRQREDYEAAIAFARRELGASAIAVWGSSFSGGTALVCAARDPEIRAVVAQCPFLATPPSQQPDAPTMARFVFWTVLDLARARLGAGAPVYLPAFGRPGELAFAKSRENPSVWDAEHPGRHDFWRALPKQIRGGWENVLLARVFASLDREVPMEHVARIRCPVLLVAAERDDMVPAAFVREARAKLVHPESELASYDALHFDLYLGDVLRANAARQAAFLVRQLMARG
jgi:pimeloyl-ACP methyl ester carboxylesterase